jgi:hypothetical protein
VVNGDYFLIHHTPADTIARITPKQIADNAGAIAVMAYVVADWPWRLGKDPGGRFTFPVNQKDVKRPPGSFVVYTR